MKSKQPTSSDIKIVPVVSNAQLDTFIRVAEQIYQADPAWVAPLRLERKMHLSPRHNPFFHHAKWQAWIAYKAGHPVGRISAQIDQLYLDRYEDKTGFFGLLEAEDDSAVFAALLSTAETWLKEQGIEYIRGPFNLSINEETGLLIDGFATPPVFMMGHAWPYYAEQLERQGYQKVKDTLAYTIAPDFDAPPVMKKLISRASKGLTIRAIDSKNFKKEIETLREIFNDAWSENWGFIPFTQAEFDELGQNLRFLIDNDLIQIAEIDREAVAFIVVMPNINEVIRDFDGKLFPFNWIKLIWRLKVRFPQTARVPLMGVRKKYQNTRLGPALAFLVIDAARQQIHQRGAREIELSWILEDNAGMRNIIESIGGRVYKRYRVYERKLLD